MKKLLIGLLVLASLSTHAELDNFSSVILQEKNLNYTALELEDSSVEEITESSTESISSPNACRINWDGLYCTTGRGGQYWYVKPGSCHAKCYDDQIPACDKPYCVNEPSGNYGGRRYGVRLASCRCI